MSEKPWGGVFAESTDSRVELFTESISFDRRLYEHDIRASIAHARMLSECGLLTADEFDTIERTLVQIKREIESGEFAFSPSLEDIHMHIEKRLTDLTGDVGRKLHTARSRNDQVQTDLRLWIRDALDAIDRRLRDVQAAFVSRCERDFDVILPGYTHTQRAQPILAPHYWLAYCEKLDRDRTRLADCRKRLNISPLGVAALAGTSLPISRTRTAELLGFSGITFNSLDTSSDRDFVLESAFVLTQIALHLATLAEEWILWTTTEFGFLKCPQAFCTGSSIMPQKVNPDVLELMRGKSARVVGSLQTLIVLTKGLPLAYNRDLQEDKEPIFDAFDTVNTTLAIAAPLIAGAELQRDNIARHIEEGYLDATTLMEFLITQNVPQRTAHGIVGRLVKTAMEKKLPLASLPLETFQEIWNGFDATVYDILGTSRAIAAFCSDGSTAPEQVRKQIGLWQLRLTHDANSMQSEREA
ncbi:MAG: argininosuccinate lyase [Thermoguttaceae bacterium]